MKDKYMRSLAEVDNVRNIAKRDVQMQLPMLLKNLQKHCWIQDNLTRALEHVPKMN